MNARMQRIANIVKLYRLNSEIWNMPKIVGGGLYGVTKNDGVVMVTYRGTTVVKFLGASGEVVLDSRSAHNGKAWRTVTTKRAMNAALTGTQYGVHGVNKEWIVWDGDLNVDLPYVDGMTLLVGEVS